MKNRTVIVERKLRWLSRCNVRSDGNLIRDVIAVVVKTCPSLVSYKSLSMPHPAITAFLVAWGELFFVEMTLSLVVPMNIEGDFESRFKGIAGTAESIKRLCANFGLSRQINRGNSQLLYGWLLSFSYSRANSTLEELAVPVENNSGDSNGDCHTFTAQLPLKTIRLI